MGKEGETSQQHLLMDPPGLQRLNFALIFFPQSRSLEPDSNLRSSVKNVVG